MPNFATRLVTCVLFITTLFSVDAFGCACCSDPGTYYLRTAKAEAYDLEVVHGLKYAAGVDLYETEAGFELIKGLNAVREEVDEATIAGKDAFTVSSATFANGRWRFVLRTPAGKKGSLTLAQPPRFTEFKVDTHELQPGGNGPLLYKEFRFDGSVTAADGFLRAAAVRNTRFSLVYQGRGLACNQVEDFANWRLAITGPRADFAIFGKLSSGSENEFKPEEPAN